MSGLNQAQNVERVKYFYKSGGLVRSTFSFLPALKRYRPKLVFVQIGGNDIGKLSEHKMQRKLKNSAVLSMEILEQISLLDLSLEDLNLETAQRLIMNLSE